MGVWSLQSHYENEWVNFKKIPRTLKGATAGSSSISIPSHASGDLLLLYAVGGSASNVPYGGTAPSWTFVNPGTSKDAIYWAFATASNHVIGSWPSGPSQVSCVVFSSPLSSSANPIGATASTGDAGGVYPWAPAINLQNSSGSSKIIHFICTPYGTNYPFPASTPAGYTTIADATSPYQIRVFSKNDTTSDGKVDVGYWGVNGSCWGCSVEVLT